MSALANPVFIPVQEYLRTSYRPDCDYIDGILEERNLGEESHAALQGYFAYLFRGNATAWDIRVYPEYRIQVTTTRYRVPDVTVVRTNTPREPVLRTPPLLIIEILSPEDSLSRLKHRVTDYIHLGVEHVWIIDPADRRVYLADDRGFHEPAEGSAAATLTIPGTAITVSLADVWRELSPA